MRTILRASLPVIAALGFFAAVPSRKTLADTPASAVSLNTQNAGPRQIEDTTERAVTRDYAAAWQAMAKALDQNRTDVLGPSFVGTAEDKLEAAVKDQRKSGLHQRIVDRGHKVDAVFYSSEGSAMELHDTAQVQLQLMDGDKVLHSEDATIRYVVLLTAAENSWKVRVLEAVPSF